MRGRYPFVFIDGQCVSYHRKNKTLAYKFYRAIVNQKTRCSNKKSRDYRNWGAKGIEVEYTFDELWAWVHNQKKTENELWKLEVGRIDHDKNYSLDNIELQTKRENTKERHKRNPVKTRTVMISDFKTKKDLCIASSILEAAYLTSTHKGSVGNILAKRKHCHSAGGFSFRYFE